MFNNIYVLSLSYLIFLLLGGLIFKNTVWEVQEDEVVVEPEQWTKLKAILSSPNPPKSEDETTALVAWLLGRCSHLAEDTSLLLTTPGNQSWIESQIEERCPDLHITVTNVTYNYKWRFVDAVYFSMTVATTIGYGHISPKNVAGRVASILYGLVGIPLTGILLAWTSTFFGEQLFRVFKSKLDKEKQRSKRFIALGTVIYIMIGFVVFIFIPAFIFMQIEKEWTYFEGVYYSFITLTTIGFGDFVSGSSLEGFWLYVYQFAVIVWIISGLGYWVMVANFITRAIKSKRMHSFALKRATDVKQLMKEVGFHNDPQFLTHTSKATLNFMLQLSSAIVAPELLHQQDQFGETKTGNAPIVGIPGIAALFGRSGMGGMGSPLFDHMAAGGVFSPIMKTESVAGSKSTLDLDVPDPSDRSSSHTPLMKTEETDSPQDAEVEEGGGGNASNLRKEFAEYEIHVPTVDYESELPPRHRSAESKNLKSETSEISDTESFSVDYDDPKSNSTECEDLQSDLDDSQRTSDPNSSSSRSSNDIGSKKCLGSNPILDANSEDVRQTSSPKFDTNENQINSSINEIQMESKLKVRSKDTGPQLSDANLPNSSPTPSSNKSTLDINGVAQKEDSKLKESGSKKSLDLEVIDKAIIYSNVEKNCIE